MNDNDTSDEAMLAESGAFKTNACFPSDAFEAGWQECRRRCEAQKERERKVFEAGFLASRCEAQKERERKAFEAGFLARNMKNWNSVEAYRAFKEAP